MSEFSVKTSESQRKLMVVRQITAGGGGALAVIQPTQQMASVWLTTALTSLRKQQDVDVLNRAASHPSPTSDGMIHSAFLASELFRSSVLSVSAALHNDSFWLLESSQLGVFKGSEIFMWSNV